MSLDSKAFEDLVTSEFGDGAVYKSKFRLQTELIDYVSITTGFWDGLYFSSPEAEDLPLNKYSEVGFEVVKGHCTLDFSEFEELFPEFAKRLYDYKIPSGYGYGFYKVPVSLVEEFFVSIGYESSSAEEVQQHCCKCGCHSRCKR